MRRLRELSLPVGIFLAALGFFLLTGSREKPWGDATPIWEVADSLVRRGSVAIATPWPTDLPRGADGRIYGVAPLVQALVHVPGAALRKFIGTVAPASAPYTVPLFSHVGPALVGAWLCVLFFATCCRQGAARAAALAGTLILGLCTTLWVYARSPYSEILQALAFLGFWDALVRLQAGFGRRDFLRLGAWAGLCVATKPVYLAILPGALIWMYCRLRRTGTLAWLPFLRGLALSGLAALPFAAIILGYNWVRWGMLGNAGYVLKPTGDIIRLSPFGEHLWTGLWGLFLSPGKSVWIYSPALLLSAWALPKVWPHMRPALVALAATAGPVLLVYGSFLFWAGDYAWGPRYIVFLVPCLLIPTVLALPDLFSGRWRRVIAGTVLGAGLVVQILGISFFWDHHIRLSQEVSRRWLGSPDRSGAATSTHDGLCGACFEDTHGLQWLPPFQAVSGHAWFMRHVPFGHDWQTAEADAPWRRYTNVRMDLSERWQKVRIDLWPADLWTVHPGITAGLAGLFVGLIGAGVFLIRRGKAA